eukprot:gnl/TRDRNA2_/TRDRNA2_170096_c2_seq1.p1 gnl/TRDRNA2_/TRDRNA2_170096_c2~~gnl/TRDRNA2_/TRDRNA2_170096_c2_seq1.p1  ORF type:complete len:122 (+),score=10.32 gnl/TRDRNA2_/TRDRNA2_170096_c2_seq1:33-368(+)
MSTPEMTSGAESWTGACWAESTRSGQPSTVTKSEFGRPSWLGPSLPEFELTDESWAGSSRPQSRDGSGFRAEPVSSRAVATPARVVASAALEPAITTLEGTFDKIFDAFEF